jgi:hypothetical protein
MAPAFCRGAEPLLVRNTGHASGAGRDHRLTRYPGKVGGAILAFPSADLLPACGRFYKCS